MIKKILLFGLVMLLSVAAIGQNKRVRGNFVGSKYAGKSVFIDTLGYTVVDSSAADIIQIDSVFQGAMLQYDTTNGWESVDRAAILGYKEYVALLTQTGTDAPVATVIYNDLGGTVVWTRVAGADTGDYRGTLVGAFASNKTLIISKTGYISPPFDEDTFISTGIISEDVIRVFTAAAEASADSVLTGYYIVVRVYN